MIEGREPEREREKGLGMAGKYIASRIMNEIPVAVYTPMCSLRKCDSAQT
jgi:hypothetical protein